PPRQSHANAGRDAGALGLPLCVRHMVLPHDADATVECRGKAHLPACHGGVFRAGDRHATPRDRHLPVRAVRTRGSVRHPGAAEATRLSAARNRLTPSSNEASFITISAFT